MSFSKKEHRGRLPKLPTQIMAEKELATAAKQSVNAQVPKAEAPKAGAIISQTNSPFHKVPVEIQRYIFGKLELSHRKNIILSSKELKEVADSNLMWQYECALGKVETSKDVQNFKEHYKKAQHLTVADKDYYIVGGSLNCVEKGFFDLYPKARSKYSEEEVSRSYPSKGVVKVFESFQDALTEAQSKQIVRNNLTTQAPVIFRVRIKGNQAVKLQKMEVNRGGMSALLPRPKAPKITTYFDMDVEKVRELKSAKVSASNFELKYGESNTVLSIFKF